MPLEPVEPRRLYRQIAVQLRRLMDEGEYPVGSRLPTERELADKLDVSRPTVREALIALEVEGRLSIRVGSGIYVIAHKPTTVVSSARLHEGPFEVLRARAFVERAVAEEAARRTTDEDVARLDAILAGVERKALAPRRWLALDRRFHIAIVAILNNAVLIRTVRELFDQRNNPYFEKLARHTENASTCEAAHQEHKAIRDAIASRNPARARTAMNDHLERSHERYARDFGEPTRADSKVGTRGARPRSAVRRRKTAESEKTTKALHKEAACQ